MDDSQDELQIDPEVYYKAKISLLEEALAESIDKAARFAAALAQVRAENGRLSRLSGSSGSPEASGTASDT